MSERRSALWERFLCQVDDVSEPILSVTEFYLIAQPSPAEVRIFVNHPMAAPRSPLQPANRAAESPRGGGQGGGGAPDGFGGVFEYLAHAPNLLLGHRPLLLLQALAHGG
jgi:hypothetical protein